MTIASEITRINNNIAAAYTACDGKGATMPQTQNSANLASCINSITIGGGSGGLSGTITLYAWQCENDLSKYAYTTSSNPRRGDLIFVQGESTPRNYSTVELNPYGISIIDSDCNYYDRVVNDTSHDLVISL